MTEQKKKEYAGDIFGNYNEPCDKYCVKIIPGGKSMTKKKKIQKLDIFWIIFMVMVFILLIYTLYDLIIYII